MKECVFGPEIKHDYPFWNYSDTSLWITQCSAFCLSKAFSISSPSLNPVCAFGEVQQDNTDIWYVHSDIKALQEYSWVLPSINTSGHFKTGGDGK